MENLATDPPIEEPDVTTESLRPGVFNTEMQKQVRAIYAAM